MTATWLTQFIMLCIYRFAHTGKVCSGDYSAENMIQNDISGADDKYNIYYMRQEGDFFFYYIVCCGILLLALILLACCFGSVLFMAGSFTALKFAESILTNIDSLPEMMRGGPGAAGKEDRYQRQKEEEKKEERTDEQRFAEEF